jgi:hypothetical protein
MGTQIQNDRCRMNSLPSYADADTRCIAYPKYRNSGNDGCKAGGRHDSPKGFTFIPAGRDLRKTVTFRPLPARQDFVFSPALQAVLSAHRFRRSMTCGYESPAFQVVSRDGKQSYIIIYGVQILKFVPGFLTPHPQGRIKISINIFI